MAVISVCRAVHCSVQPVEHTDRLLNLQQSAKQM